jgi:hypothetical protein
MYDDITPYARVKPGMMHKVMSSKTSSSAEDLAQKEPVPNEPRRVSEKRFVEELSAENIEKLQLIGPNGVIIKFSDLYEYKHFLGKGGFGYVVYGVIRETGLAVALKVSQKNIN